MPELPEVECLSQATAKIIRGCTITEINFLRSDLRLPIPIAKLRSILVGNIITAVFRRSKYMLWRSERGYGIIHLGMTGNLLNWDTPQPVIPHTHCIFTVALSAGNNTYLHFVDPRRFGLIEAHRGDDIAEHRLLKHLGIEPLCPTSDLIDHLWHMSRNRKSPIKNFIMNAKIVVGVGNIYASESLYKSKIHPCKAAQDLTKRQFSTLSRAIQETLKEAITSGGTSFRDFKNTNGSPGYFAQKLATYGREKQPCGRCKSPIACIKIAGRSSFYCPRCQKMQ